MLKNQELIYRMSLHQRIRLITSSSPDENCAVDSYEFPVFHLYPNPTLQTSDKFATFFPSDKALAACWNGETVKNVYECIGNEAKANKEYAYFNISNCTERENVSEDGFISCEFLKQKALGVSASGAHLNFDDAPATDDEAVLNETVKNITDGILKSRAAKSIRLCSPEAVETYKRRYSFDGLIFGVAHSAAEVAAYLSSGCTLVFVNPQTAEGLEDFLVSLTEKYSSVKAEFDEGKITLAEFDALIRSGDILDEEAVNAACDGMISLLLALKECNAASVDEKITQAGKVVHEPLFNEVYHDKLASAAASQSLVLIKNNNKIIPFNKDTKVAVIGEYATNNDYRITNGNIPTSLHRPFDEINKYNSINAVGYAHGYSAGEVKRLDLIETALNLYDDADVALVYLCAGKGATALPQGQIELIDALSRRGAKIVAVVEAERPIDMSFADKCQAVLFSYGLGQGGAKAVFDVLSGEISPSGKLVDTFYKNFEAVTVEQGVPAYCSAAASNVRYPFGYGLSFTEFECKYLKVNAGGVSCTVTNKGNFDGYCTLQLYVQRMEANTTLANRVLRGYGKVFVKKGDTEKLSIPFTDDTFKVYDRDKKRLFAQGGKYEISLCDNAEAVLLRASYDVKERVFDSEYENKEQPLPKDKDVSFTQTELDKYIRREKKKLSYGFRLFITLMLTLYYDAMGAGLLLSNVIENKTFVLYAVVGLLLLVGNLLALIYIIIISKRRKLQRYLHPNEVLSDMVDNVDEFEEVAKITYNKPVEQPILEFNPADEEEVEEEEVVRHYDATFTEEDEEVEFTPKVSFGELCSSFRAFAARRGAAIEPSSVRSLIAAMVSGKVVILSCKNKEALPALCDSVCAYFGVGARAAASDEWNSQEDLLWKKGDGQQYLLSDVSNAINSAGKTAEKNCFIMLENVNFANLCDYFSTFLDYANFPSEEHTVNFSDSVSLKMPSNVCFLLVPSSDNFAEDFTPAAAHASIVVDVVATKTAPVAAEDEEVKVISRESVKELIDEAREQFFVGEAIWKKIDEFCEAVNATERFSIDNKSLLQLEKYTSVLMECGGDEGEALTAMFTAKIVPLIKVSRAYKKEGGGKSLYGIIEKLFVDENLSAIQKSLLANA